MELRGGMECNRLPKQLLFGELVKKRPSHGTKRRWRDVAAVDIKTMPSVKENGMIWPRGGAFGEQCVRKAWFY